MTSWSAEQYQKHVDTYMEAVEQEFTADVGTIDTYLHFLGAATEFQEKRIDTAEWVERVKELLDGQWLLLLRFANFLPQDYGCRLREEVLAKRRAEKAESVSRGEPVDYVHLLDQATDVLGRIKARFLDENLEHLYETFLEIVHMHRTGEKTREEVLHAVADNIFQTKHQDLLHEFRYFLQIWSSALVIEISKVGLIPSASYQPQDWSFLSNCCAWWS